MGRYEGLWGASDVKLNCMCIHVVGHELSLFALSLNLDHFLLVIGWNTLKVTDERECKVAISMQVGSDRFFVFFSGFFQLLCSRCCF